MRMLFALLLLLSTHASATVIYNWTGTCAIGCEGTARAQLALKDYVPGKPFVDGFFEDPQYFVTFKYSDNIGSFSHDAFDTFGSGTLPSDTGLAPLLWCFNACSDFRFRETADGLWEFKTEITAITGRAASGSNGVFVPQSIPEPATLALLLLALLIYAVGIKTPFAKLPSG